jgi:hypothetical protein
MSAPTRQVVVLLRPVLTFNRWHEVAVGDRAITVECRGLRGWLGVIGRWPVRRVIWTYASGHVGFCPVKGPTDILAVGAINRSVASLGQ